MPFDKPTLRLGDTGPMVVRLQEDLVAVACPPGAMDGVFGADTANGVTQFQSAVGLVADGIAGPDTWSVLEGPDPTVEQSIELADFPALALALRHGTDGAVDAYL